MIAEPDPETPFGGLGGSDHEVESYKTEQEETEFRSPSPMNFHDDIDLDNHRESEFPGRIDTNENMIVEETPRKLIDEEEPPEIQP